MHLSNKVAGFAWDGGCQGTELPANMAPCLPPGKGARQPAPIGHDKIRFGDQSRIIRAGYDKTLLRLPRTLPVATMGRRKEAVPGGYEQQRLSSKVRW